MCPGYGGQVSMTDGSSDTGARPPRAGRGRSIAIYTALRFALFAVVWLLLELLTPVRGWWALAAAILISGMVSAFALNRQRDDMSVGIAGFFGRMNARIDAANRAEDERDDALRAQLLVERGAASSAGVASEREQDAQPDAVDEQHDSGLFEHGDEGRPDGSGA